MSSTPRRRYLLFVLAAAVVSFAAVFLSGSARLEAEPLPLVSDRWANEKYLEINRLTQTALGEKKDGRTAIPAGMFDRYVELTGDADPLIRRTASAHVWTLARRPLGLVEATDPDLIARRGEQLQRLKKLLPSQLTDSDPECRWSAFQNYVWAHHRSIRENPAKAEPLLPFLHDPDPMVRAGANQVLKTYGLPAEK